MFDSDAPDKARVRGVVQDIVGGVVRDPSTDPMVRAIQETNAKFDALAPAQSLFTSAVYPPPSLPHHRHPISLNLNTVSLTRPMIIKGVNGAFKGDHVFIVMPFKRDCPNGGPESRPC